MSITGPDELAGMRAAGAIVRRMLEAMKRAVRSGITTAELDEVGATVMRDVMEVPNAGSFSIIVDPTGAMLGLWQPKAK